MTKHKYFSYTLLFAIFLGFLPTIMLISKYGYYPRIPLEIMDDTLYYLGRVREVLMGNYFIGNSYLVEKVGEVTTAFFVADWIYSIPFFGIVFFGLPIAIGLVFSEAFWTVTTSILLYFLYKKLDIEDRYMPLVVTFSLLSVLFYILRPVTMAVVYPVFILFLISFLAWLNDPTNNKNKIYLTLSSTLSFYVYTYLWQLVLVVLGLTFLLSLFTKKSIKELFVVLISTLFLSLPVFVYTWRQLNSEFYFETLNRVGLINTHSLGSSAFLYTFLLFVCLFLIYVFKKRELINNVIFIFFGIITFSLIITGISNVITGKDLELAVHVGRFTELYIAIFVTFSFWVLYVNRDKVNKLIYLPVLFLFCYSSYLIYLTSIIAVRSLPVQNNDYIYELISFINTLPEKSVILANDSVSSYIPVMTKSYVAFHPNAELYLASNDEIEERYLVSRIFIDLDKAQLKSDFRKYAGVGNAVHKAKIVNRNAKICGYIKSVVSLNCNTSTTTSYLLKGELYFDELIERYKFIKKNSGKFLDMYGVHYILVAQNESWILPGDLKLVWSNQDYFVYSRGE